MREAGGVGGGEGLGGEQLETVVYRNAKNSRLSLPLSRIILRFSKNCILYKINECLTYDYLHPCAAYYKT